MAPGGYGVIEYDLILKSGQVKPVTSRESRPVPMKLQAEVRLEIDKMLTEGVIRESTSPWNSPIHCVRKPDGKIRFCIDFREVNDVTATLDAASGYWQVPLTAGARPITAFSFNGHHYEFNVLPFGVKNGPAIFSLTVANRLGSTLMISNLAERRLTTTLRCSRRCSRSYATTASR
jgi:hypothetical protein